MEDVYTTDEIVFFIGSTLFFIILFIIRNDFPKNSIFSPSNFLPQWIDRPLKYLMAASAISIIIISTIIVFVLLFMGIENIILLLEEEYYTYGKIVCIVFIMLTIIILPFAVKYIDID